MSVTPLETHSVKTSLLDTTLQRQSFTFFPNPQETHQALRDELLEHVATLECAASETHIMLRRESPPEVHSSLAS